MNMINKLDKLIDSFVFDIYANLDYYLDNEDVSIMINNNIIYVKVNAKMLFLNIKDIELNSLYIGIEYKNKNEYDIVANNYHIIDNYLNDTGKIMFQTFYTYMERLNNDVYQLLQESEVS